jgi:hypothetical protein
MKNKTKSSSGKQCLFLERGRSKNMAQNTIQRLEKLVLKGVGLVSDLKRAKILAKFTIAEIENQITFQSIVEALECNDELKWYEIGTKTKATPFGIA